MVDFRGGLDELEKRTSFALAGSRSPDRPTRGVVTVTTVILTPTLQRTIAQLRNCATLVTGHTLMSHSALVFAKCALIILHLRCEQVI